MSTQNAEPGEYPYQTTETVACVCKKVQTRWKFEEKSRDRQTSTKTHRAKIMYVAIGWEINIMQRKVKMLRKISMGPDVTHKWVVLTKEIHIIFPCLILFYNNGENFFVRERQLLWIARDLHRKKKVIPKKNNVTRTKQVDWKTRMDARN